MAKSVFEETQQALSSASDQEGARVPVSLDQLSPTDGPGDEQRKHKRRHVQRACEACRKSKVKCDDKRPCSFCVRNGDAVTCRSSSSDPNAPNEDENWYLNDQESAFLLSKPKRKQVSRACLQCRRSKVKCDESRPCGRCKRLGKGGSCLQSEDSKGDELSLAVRNVREEDSGEIERPIG